VNKENNHGLYKDGDEERKRENVTMHTLCWSFYAQLQNCEKSQLASSGLSVRPSVRPSA